MSDQPNNMGRPPLFDNPEALQSKVDEYFIWVLGEREWVVNDSGEREERVKRAACHTTVTGMALFLGFESRQSIYDYEERGDFSYIIKKARMKVEDAYEQRLHGTTPTGAIFALKNMGWKDKTEQDLNVQGQLGITWNEQRTYDKPEEGGTCDKSE